MDRSDSILFPTTKFSLLYKYQNMKKLSFIDTMQYRYIQDTTIVATIMCR
jgi:hypothetical protein